MNEELTSEETQRLWELYVVHCMNSGLTPKLDSFSIWMDERS